MIHLQRATVYGHDHGDLSPDGSDWTIDPLDATEFAVSRDEVEDGLITLSARRAACHARGCPSAIEFDLTPADARALAQDLISEAAACGGCEEPGSAP